MSGEGVPLRWIDGLPAATVGSTFGVPWPRGALAAGDALSLRSAAGDVPLQTWPLATWPDGSVKWSGHAVAAGTGLSDDLRIVRGTPASPENAVSVKRSGTSIVISTGAMEAVVAASGPSVVTSLRRGGRTTAHDGRLVLRTQDSPDSAAERVSTSTWRGVVTGAEVEQDGPVRAVVRLDGHFEPATARDRRRQGSRSVLPWTMRLSTTAGSDALTVVHSFVYDADPSQDYVSGLGLEIDVPMSDEAYNRHVRFSGPDRGVWGEPVLVLTGLRREPGQAVDDAQFAGTATPPPSQWASTVSGGYTDLPLWNDYSLVQDDADGFSVRKRTKEGYRWLPDAGFGTRATGLGYVGGVSGGLAFGLRNFWQQHPRALDIRGAAGETATVTLWSWSPYGDPMDLRGYDAAGHGLGLAYEDPRHGFGDVRGTARSTRMDLWALDATPSRSHFADLAEALSTSPQVVTTPETYHAAKVFGRWSLPDRSTAARRTLEDSISAGIDFYVGQVEQRHWYGFWSFGDVMHTYDADRHTWRYDVGGFAWDNGELGSDASLWYAFLRSGDAATFHLARHMTTHIAESDSYHAGEFAGLGSRHNVLHYGDGAKEARVNESYTKRFLYYVTADELIGDYLTRTLQVDQTMLKNPPLRDYLDPPAGVPSVVRIGPDWYAMVSNWLAAWERTGEDKWRDRIVTGMRDIASFPAGLFTGEFGGAVGFDPKTAHLSNLDKGDYHGGYNLAMAFCGDQIMFEVVELVDVPEFRAKLLEFARYVQAPSSEKVAHFGFDFNPQVFKTIYSRVTAWAGDELDEPAIRKRGWDQYLADPAGKPWPAPVKVDGTDVLVPVEEVPSGDFSTNDFAQRNLAIIELLALAPAEAP